MSTPLVVLKFGSSVIPSESALPAVVGEIGRWRGRGYQVVAVVSAIGDTTDRLISRAKRISPDPDEYSLAALLATGESETVALLSLSLNKAGIAANPLDHAALDLRSIGPALDSSARHLAVGAAFDALDDRPVLVVPGFLARDALGRTTCLGRGGSDLSALFIARALNAECRLVKDVAGLYESDPAEHPGARRFAAIRWNDVLKLDEGIVQHKAVRFAWDHGLSFTIGSIGSEEGTEVGAGPTRFDTHDADARLYTEAAA